MPYEADMSINYDEKSGQLTVYFRGDRKELGRFKNHAEALKAGEAYCRKHGWSG